MSLETPIAFLIFNRPDLTRRVFARIAQARPQRLLVVCDGPRSDRPGEAERVAATRAVVDGIDWPCEVSRNYAESNLGCRRRIASGLDWVFATVEEAIVLEDDCLPDPTFFGFCQELLQRYRHDQRVVAISGDNFQLGQSRTRHSYYFSKYPHIWGWASWRRAWAQYDVTMSSWPEFRDSGALRWVTDSPAEEWFWAKNFEAAHRGEVNTWDFAWLYACWRQSGLAVLPDVNLVSNIGFGDEGTHTQNPSNPYANLPTRSLGPLDHPAYIVRHREADMLTFSRSFYRDTWLRRLRRGVRRRLRELAARFRRPEAAAAAR